MTAPTRKKKVGPYGGKIAKQHADYLGARAVSADVARERAYRSVRTRPTIRDAGMSPGTPLPGLLIPVMWNREPVLHPELLTW